MSGYRCVNFYQLCRFCTTNEGERLPILHGEGLNKELPKKLGYLSIQVSERDFLPKYICIICLDKLEKCIDFRNICMSAEYALDSYAASLLDNEDFKKNGTVYVKDTFELPNLPLTKLSDGTFHSFNAQNITIKTENCFAQSEPTDFVDEVQMKVRWKPEQIIVENVPIKTEEVNNYSDVEIIEDDIVKEEYKITTTKYRSEPDCIEILDEPRFVCNTCKRSFKKKDYLRRHLALHSVVKPFKCKYCSRTFHRKEYLMKHEPTHTGEKEFICDICFKSFNRKDNLTKHRKIHVEPYMCEYCGRKFIDENYYSTHKQMHVKNGVPDSPLSFQCYLCPRKFAKKFILNDHLKKHIVVPESNNMKLEIEKDPLDF